MAKREEPAWRRALEKPKVGRASVRIVVRTFDSMTVVDVADGDKEKAFALLRLFAQGKADLR